MHFYLKIANTNHIGILDVLLTETMLVTMQNPCLLPLWSQIRRNRAESGPSRFLDHLTGSELTHPSRHEWWRMSLKLPTSGNMLLRFRVRILHIKSGIKFSVSLPNSLIKFVAKIYWSTSGDVIVLLRVPIRYKGSLCQREFNRIVIFDY